MKHIVITGVSTGIGRATAQVLIKHGAHVFGSVRRMQDAEQLVSELGEQFTPLLFDVTDVQSVQEAAAQVQEHLDGKKLFGLVNNAGTSRIGPLLYVPIEEFRQQIETNLTGALVVTQAFAPLLGAKHELAGNPGRIINVSSIGGKIAYPFNGSYHASKFGLEGLSESLRRELLIHGIDVVVLAPGSVATSIWSKLTPASLSPYAQTEYADALRLFQEYIQREEQTGYDPTLLGEIIWKIFSTPLPRVRYSVVPKPLLNWYLLRLLPKRVLDSVVARQLGLKKIL